MKASLKKFQRVIWSKKESRSWLQKAKFCLPCITSTKITTTCIYNYEIKSSIYNY